MMDHLGIPLSEYRRLSAHARMALRYFLMMKHYFEKDAMKKRKKKMEEEARFKNKLPAQQRPGRRGGR